MRIAPSPLCPDHRRESAQLSLCFETYHTHFESVTRVKEPLDKNNQLSMHLHWLYQLYDNWHAIDNYEGNDKGRVVLKITTNGAPSEDLSCLVIVYIVS